MGIKEIKEMPVKVWIGYTYNIGEQGYEPDHTSFPLIAFSNEKPALIWKKLEKDRKLQVLEVKNEVECHTCRSKLK